MRPGTYEITSERYDEAPNIYFDWNNKSEVKITKNRFKLNKIKEQKINNLLNTNKINLDSKGLIKFIKEAIELREFSKFSFTKNLSDILYLINKLKSISNFKRRSIIL